MLGTILALLLWLVASPALAQDYRIGIGDTVSIKVFGEPQLSRDAFVPQNCQVVLELIGPVDVCNRAVSEVADELTARLADGYLVQPHVVVVVTTYGSQQIEVRGSVKKPGLQVMSGPTSLSRAITAAGGPDGDNVVEVDLVRSDGTVSTYQLSKLNVEEDPVMVAGGDTVVLRQGRHVYVDGEVKTVGQVAYHEGLTVSQAVSLAGGPGVYASLRRVTVVSTNGDRKVVNLLKVRSGRADDPVLAPDDRITLRRALF